MSCSTVAHTSERRHFSAALLSPSLMALHSSGRAPYRDNSKSNQGISLPLPSYIMYAVCVCVCVCVCLP